MKTGVWSFLKILHHILPLSGRTVFTRPLVFFFFPVVVLFLRRHIFRNLEIYNEINQNITHSNSNVTVALKWDAYIVSNVEIVGVSEFF